MSGGLGFLSNLIPVEWRAAAAAALVVTVVGGAFGYGWHLGDVRATNQIAQFKVQEAKQQAKVQAAETKVDTKVVTKYVPQIQYVTQWRTRNAEAIAVVPDDKYFLSNGWVSTHDAAVGQLDLNPAAAADAASSGVTADQALETVTYNYTQVCQANAEQLKALQAWVVETQKNVAKNGG